MQFAASIVLFLLQHYNSLMGLIDWLSAEWVAPANLRVIYVVNFKKSTDGVDGDWKQIINLTYLVVIFCRLFLPMRDLLLCTRLFCLIRAYFIYPWGRVALFCRVALGAAIDCSLLATILFQCHWNLHFHYILSHDFAVIFCCSFQLYCNSVA